MSDSKRLTSVGRPATDAEWTAVSTRHGRLFLFVVTSTGIICTPGCPARVPGRDRVRVVSGVAEGLELGARPCLRCHPDRGDGRGRKVAADPVQSAVDLLAAAIDAGDDVPTDGALAGELGLPDALKCFDLLMAPSIDAPARAGFRLPASNPIFGGARIAVTR